MHVAQEDLEALWVVHAFVDMLIVGFFSLTAETEQAKAEHDTWTICIIQLEVARSTQEGDLAFLWAAQWLKSHVADAGIGKMGRKLSLARRRTGFSSSGHFSKGSI